MPSIRLSLFGLPKLERDGVILPIQRRKTLALLAYLAVTTQSHSREALATLLWPENDQSSALASLRRELSRLKDILGEEILRIEQRVA
jgi:DNA-binding SARP family transcriptional activator